MGGRARPYRQMSDCQSESDYCQLCSIDVVGPLFTWSILREGEDLIQQRLDRFAGNIDWLEKYPTCKTQNIATSVSDHNCLVLNTTDVGNLFRFEAMWVGTRGCEETIEFTWDLYKMESLVEKLK